MFEPCMPLEELRARVAASRAAQGLPPTIQDRATLAKAAVLILTARAARAATAAAGERRAS